MYQKIENFLNQKITCRLLPLETPDPAFVYRLDHKYGILVSYQESDPVKLPFKSAGLCDIEINGEYHGKYLFFYCTEERFLHQFSMLCVNFLEPANLAKLRVNPQIWWESWKNLLGNTISNDSAYPVIGELIVYLGLLKKNPATVVWKGPDKALHDIETEAASYEVKSTIVRTDRIVTISNEYQLGTANNKSLYLTFLRFEERLQGEYSLKKCVDSISDIAIRGDVLKKLKKMGFEPGSPGYAVEYTLLEGYLYLVNDSFPRITVDNLVAMNLRDRIQTLSYGINLMGMACEELKNQIDCRLLK